MLDTFLNDFEILRFLMSLIVFLDTKEVGFEMFSKIADIDPLWYHSPSFTNPFPVEISPKCSEDSTWSTGFAATWKEIQCIGTICLCLAVIDIDSTYICAAKQSDLQAFRLTSFSIYWRNPLRELHLNPKLVHWFVASASMWAWVCTASGQWVQAIQR